MKAGFSICIDDLPDHYKLKEKVIEWESVFWKEEIEPNIFKALIDTTLLYISPILSGNLLTQTVSVFEPDTLIPSDIYLGI